MIDDDGVMPFRRATAMQGRFGVPRSARTEFSRVPMLSRLAISQMTTYRWSLLDAVSAYRQAGIPAIGVWRRKLHEFGELRGIDLVHDSGLKVSGLSCAGGFTGTHGQTFAEALDDAREALRLAAALRAETLTVVSGGRAGHTFNHARRLFVEALRQLADEAAESGVTLAVQPLHVGLFPECSFLGTLDQTLDVVTSCDHSHVRMVLDVYHLWQEPRLIERIPQVVPWMSLVRLSDWREPPRSQHDRCLPGDGLIPLGPILRAVLGAGYEGRFEIDVWSEDLWAGDYDKLLHACRTRFLSLFIEQG